MDQKWKQGKLIMSMTLRNHFKNFEVEPKILELIIFSTKNLFEMTQGQSIFGTLLPRKRTL